MPYIGVEPAYGRDYKTQKEVRADWAADKDFRITDYGPDDGRLINRQQVPAGTHVTVRYGNGRKTVQVC